MKITEEKFYEKYIPQINHIVRAETDKSVADEDICSWSGCMYETYGEELDYIVEEANANKNNVWTIIEEDGKMYILSGYHVVNRLGYLITETPYETEDNINIVELED